MEQRDSLRKPDPFIPLNPYTSEDTDLKGIGLIDGGGLEAGNSYRILPSSLFQNVRILNNLPARIKIISDVPLVVENSIRNEVFLKVKGSLVIQGMISNNCDIQVEDQFQKSHLVCWDKIGPYTLLKADIIEIVCPDGDSIAVGAYSKLFATTSIHVTGDLENGVRVGFPDLRPLVTIVGSVHHGSVIFCSSI